MAFVGVILMCFTSTAPLLDSRHVPDGGLHRHVLDVSSPSDRAASRCSGSGADRRERGRQKARADASPAAIGVRHAARIRQGQTSAGHGSAAKTAISSAVSLPPSAMRDGEVAASRVWWIVHSCHCHGPDKQIASCSSDAPWLRPPPSISGSRSEASTPTSPSCGSTAWRNPRHQLPLAAVHVRTIMIEMDNMPMRTPGKVEYIWRDLERRASMYMCDFPDAAALPAEELRSRQPHRAWSPPPRAGATNTPARPTASGSARARSPAASRNVSKCLKEIGQDPARVLALAAIRGHRPRLRGRAPTRRAGWEFSARRASSPAAKCSGATTGWRTPCAGTSTHVKRTVAERCARTAGAYSIGNPT